ncbi:DEAD/DEAH box helicase [Corticicoccus populi]|uniref:SNF2 helicase associated domain-containing protein n=1 Tax=Corticicoccus populi TaxID=1812821 RepID=A0ABW5WVA9_9STAP
MEITESYIKNLFKDHLFRRGKKYYTEGRVRKLTRQPDNFSWHAEVSGSKIHHTQVSVKNNGISNFCTCPAFSAYGQCKHTCATLLKIAEQSLSASLTSDDTADNPARHDQTEHFIQLFKDFKPERTEKDIPSYQEILKVEFTLHAEDGYYYFTEGASFSLSMKIGTNRMYVVKDIDQFFFNMTEGIEMDFGKNFFYEPDVHYFQGSDKTVIDILTDIWKTEKFYKTKSHAWNTSQSKKMLSIPVYAADSLINNLQYTNCKYVQNEDEYMHLTLITDDMPFTFSLDHSNNEYRFTVSGIEDSIYLSDYQYYSHEGNLYKITDAQGEMISAFLNNTDIHGSINFPVAKDQVKSFVTQSVPKIKSLGAVTLSDTLKEDIISPPLTIELYVEMDSGILNVSTLYKYNDIEINPLKDWEETHDTGNILIRELSAEQAFMDILEHSPLKIKNHALFVEDPDGQFEFLYETLAVLEHHADIYMTSTVKSLMMEMPDTGSISVDAPSDGGYLEVGFKIDGIQSQDILDILSSIKEKKKYYRLPNGSFIPLPENDVLTDMAGIHHDMAKNSDTDSDTLILPMYRGLQVEDRISDFNDIPRTFNDDFKAFYQSLTSPGEEDTPIPDTLNAELRDYQYTGFKWLKSLSRYHLGGILADDMGLGKTLQCIAYLLSEKEDAPGKPSLIVAPASLTYNWKNEFEKFAPSLNVEVVSGTVPERTAVLRSDNVPDVYITSYHTLRQDVDWYKEQVFHAVILDEAQAIKNHRTKIAKAVRLIRASKRFALSGTPIENSQDELWSIFQAVMPGFLYDYKAFHNMEPETIARIVRPFIMRRLKEDVLDELPDKIENTYYTDMNPEQKKLYLAYLERIQKETANALETEGLAKGRIKILAGLTRLRQLCCHPALFIENYTGDSGKLDALFEVIENAEENNRRILLFSQFPSMLKIIQNKLKQTGRSSYYLDGSTPSKERVELVESFNHGDEGIFLISLKAGGTGLNLTGADTVVLYDLWWNPAIEEQAIGRAHRIGQKNIVQVTRLIAQGTIEEKINDLQKQKKEMIDQIIQPGESSLSSMTEDDIRDILSI